MTTPQITSPSNLLNKNKNKSQCQLLIPYLIEDIELVLSQTQMSESTRYVTMTLEKKMYSDDCVNMVIEMYKSAGWKDVVYEPSPFSSTISLVFKIYNPL